MHEPLNVLKFTYLLISFIFKRIDKLLNSSIFSRVFRIENDFMLAKSLPIPPEIQELSIFSLEIDC